MQRRLRTLAPALGAASVAMTLAACGGSSHPAATGTEGMTTGVQVTTTAATATEATFVPPPAAVAAIQLFHPMSEYTQYVEAKLVRLRPELQRLDQDLAGGDTGAARQEWLTAHRTYVEIGQDDLAYGAFGDLGGAIDGNAEGLVHGTANPKFTGFHKLELDLFRRGDLGASRTDATKLTSLVNQLTPALVQSDLALNTTSLNAWVLRTHEILEDALRDSLSSDDDYGSHSDLASVSADVTATREMLKVLQSLIDPRHPGLVTTAMRQLKAVDAAVAAAPSETTEVTRLSERERQRVDGTVSAALETLAPVSELMTISNSNS